jgi:hypothetical protein
LRNLRVRTGYTSLQLEDKNKIHGLAVSTDTASEKKQANATRRGRRVKYKVDRKVYEDDSQRKTDGYRGELQQAALNQLVGLTGVEEEAASPGYKQENTLTLYIYRELTSNITTEKNYCLLVRNFTE